jgi:hypothetical protein
LDVNRRRRGGLVLAQEAPMELAPERSFAAPAPDEDSRRGFSLLAKRLAQVPRARPARLQPVVRSAGQQ